MPFILPIPICLHSQSECKLPKQKYRLPRDAERSEMHFPILECPNLFDSHEIFHMINVNKVVKNKPDLKAYLKEDYDNYPLAVRKYSENLPKHNNELLQVFTEKTKNAKFDAIVFPNTSSEWLRDGLVDYFVQHYQVDAFEAKKNQNIMLSGFKGKPPEDFEFFFDNEVIHAKKNIIILDDCYCYGSTVNYIVKNLGLEKCYAVGCYCKDQQETLCVTQEETKVGYVTF